MRNIKAIAIAIAALALCGSICFAPMAYADGQDLTVGSAQMQAASSGSDIQVFRLYNPYSGDHHYSMSTNERDGLKRIGWVYEGVGWKSPSKSVQPLYRMYNPYSGEHHYTLNANERDGLKKIGWVYEGIAWYSDTEKGVPLYRMFNPYASIGTHHYTASEKERDHLKELGWVYEGIAWYGTVLDSSYQKQVTDWSSSISGDAELDKQLEKILVKHPSLRAAYDYVAGLSYRVGSEFTSNPRVLPDSATISFAKEMINYGSGNCYRFASLFSWLARGLGYSANAISGWVPSESEGRAPHGWTEIYINGKTYICDADMENFYHDTNWYMRTYDDPPTNYGSW